MALCRWGVRTVLSALALACAVTFAGYTARDWLQLLRISAPLREHAQAFEVELSRFHLARERLRGVRHARYTSDTHLVPEQMLTARDMHEASFRQVVAQYALAPTVLWMGSVAGPVVAELKDRELLPQALRQTSTTSFEDLGHGLYLLR